jgi:hypothetical protein
MMNETNVNTIWRPVVRPTEVPVPCWNPHDQRHSSVDQQQQKYTKTSLAHSNESSDQLVKAAEQLNQRIRDANQLFNSTPKPFIKQSSWSETDSQQQQQQQQHHRNTTKLARQSSVSSFSDKQQLNQTDKMSPKLVHQQYNSPIDLYSMSNIRKTIEAHSEMIAPGVKGINFMKHDAPVNKQSEVLKLIKEEEEEQKRRKQQQQQQQHLPSTGPTSQPISLPYTSEPRTPAPGQHQVQYAAEHAETSNYSHQQQQMRSILKRQDNTTPSTANLISQQFATSGHTSSGSLQQSQGTPKCFECGQSIVGPFAKLQDRFIHPQCFNCSTCGTSLKNSGYFTINDKLYCDIHARQVANVMRLNYNFEPNKQAVVSNQQDTDEHQRLEPPRAKQILVEKKAPSVVLEPQQQQQPKAVVLNDQAPPSHPPANVNIGANQGGGHCSHCCSGTGNQATTISTMFSGIGHHCQLCNNHCSCNRRSEIRWTWRPANIAVDNNSCQHQKQNSTENMVSSSTSSSAIMSSRSLSALTNKHESRLVASTAMGNRSTSTGNDERVPVCCHCHVQIFGPYILAGKSTWCKPCSQTNFVCNTCHRPLLNVGFIEDDRTGKYNCEHCFETYLAPICSKCNTRIRGDCLNALGKQWHPTCFVCGHCRNPFGNSSFYLEDNVPYCERDWNLLFTTKCYTCGYPIQASDKWIEALERNYHSDCFRCTGCQVKLEGSTFYCKGGKPYCRMHVR